MTATNLPPVPQVEIERERSDGWSVLEAIYDMRCDDGTLIHVRNQGLWLGTDDDWPATDSLSQPVSGPETNPERTKTRRKALASTVRAPFATIASRSLAWCCCRRASFSTSPEPVRCCLDVLLSFARFDFPA